MFSTICDTTLAITPHSAKSMINSNKNILKKKQHQRDADKSFYIVKNSIFFFRKPNILEILGLPFFFPTKNNTGKNSFCIKKLDMAVINKLLKLKSNFQLFTNTEKNISRGSGLIAFFFSFFSKSHLINLSKSLQLQIQKL